MTVEQAGQRAAELREEERKGWPNGFDPKKIGAEWNAIIWRLDTDYQNVLVTTPEIAPVIKRQHLRTIDPTWGAKK